MYKNHSYCINKLTSRLNMSKLNPLIISCEKKFDSHYNMFYTMKILSTYLRIKENEHGMNIFFK